VVLVPEELARGCGAWPLSEEPLPGGRGLPNLEQARLALATRARVRTPLGAVEFLAQTDLHGRDTYDKRVVFALESVELYREYFPDEHAASQAPPFSTQAEQEFLRLVDAKLFPLILNVGRSLEREIREEPSIFLPFIPLRGVQAHHWCDGDFDWRRIETPFKVAQVLSWMTGAGGRGWQALKHYFGLDCPEPRAPTYGAVGWSLFVFSCATDETPLRYMPQAFNYISYKTGNPWLDIPQCRGCVTCPWSSKSMANLHVAWLGVQKLGAQITELAEWFDADPRGRIARVIELWNKSLEAEVETGFEGVRQEDGRLFHMRLDGEALTRVYGDELPFPTDLDRATQAAMIRPDLFGDIAALLAD
jgi:hypothetical protein